MVVHLYLKEIAHGHPCTDEDVKLIVSEALALAERIERVGHDE
jgi:hypothetical protein